jgi:hypothetical protein
LKPAKPQVEDLLAKRRAVLRGVSLADLLDRE